MTPHDCSLRLCLQPRFLSKCPKCHELLTKRLADPGVGNSFTRHVTGTPAARGDSGGSLVAPTVVPNQGSNRAPHDSESVKECAENSNQDGIQHVQTVGELPGSGGRLELAEHQGHLQKENGTGVI